MNTVIRNAVLLREPGVLPAEEHGCVHVQGNTISWAGKEREPDFVPDRVIDAAGCLVMPGFVNMHTHIAMNVLRGYADDLPLQTWLFDKIFPAEELLTDEMVYWSSLGAACELVRAGVTCINDMYDHCEAVARAVSKSGIRAVLARGVTTRGSDNWEDKIREAEELYLHWDGKGRIRVWFAPHGQYTNTQPAIEILGELARRYKTGIHTHMSETRREHEDCIRETGLTPAAYYAKLGLMDGPFVAAHCVWTERRDMDLMAEKRTVCASCPRSNMKLGSGIAPLLEMDRRGVRLTLGTDGAASNNRLSLMTEMAYAAYAQKAAALDASVFPDTQMLHMATTAGAEALGIPAGKLEEGLEADLIMISMSSMRWEPRVDPASSLVYGAQDTDVRLTMVGGDILYENDECTFADEEEIKQKLNMYAQELRVKC